ncbi:MAG TPA: ion transporter [Bacteroidales bacterium]|nr:ion transporter [Bacteroidales bacterium]
MEMRDHKKPHKKQVHDERMRLLNTISRLTDTPLLILGIIWLVLLILELLNKTTPLIKGLGIVIWIIFIIDFVIRFTLSPLKTAFLKKNVVTAISLIVPALRILRFARILRLIRLSRGISLVKVLGSLNRGMNALAGIMKRRAFGYVVVFTLIVMFVGAAGVYAFEKDQDKAFASYSSSLWHTAMLIMNMGTDWPKTPEGRALYLVIAIFSMAVLGYITATLATFFIDRDAGKSKDSSKQIEELKKQVAALTNEIRRNRYQYRPKQNKPQS